MAKKLVRLTESDLRNTIKESVKSFINEGGHLTWKDDDGRMHTNSQDNWYGIEGATFVSHGEWSDGEIYFDYEGKQYVINANDAEEWLWTDFKEYCEENNLNPDEHSDDEIWYNFARNEGYDVLLNLGPYNESYEMNESKYMNKNKIRLTESGLHKTIKKLVNEVLNEIGDSDRIHNYLGTINGYYEAQGNSDKANRAYNLSDRLQKNRNNGQLYDPNSEESAREYRRNSYAYRFGFSKGWDKGRQQMKEATADPKQRVKVSEAQLRQIIKESAEQIMNEAYSDAQYAHLAGQAHGALNSFGGKLKGMFNSKWKRRKERQMRKFADQATRQDYGYEKSRTKGGDNNDGGAVFKMPNDNCTWHNGGQADYICNKFNPKNQKSPFEMKRNQYHVTVDDPSSPISNRSYRYMANDGDVYSRDETRSIASQHADKKEWEKYNEMNKLEDSNSMLNNAFRQGQQARKGRTHKTFGGETYTNGTGTSSGAFKRLK